MAEIWLEIVVKRQFVSLLIFGTPSNMNNLFQSQEVLEDWAFLERDLLPTLADFENPDEATEFVTVKIKSIITG